MKAVVALHIVRAVERVLGLISPAIPDFRPLNYLLSLPGFVAGQRRWPRRPDNAKAGVNDYVFARKIDSRWSAWELASTDKEFAKRVAASYQLPELRIPETTAVLPVASMSFEEFDAAVRPFHGMRLLAKPTHGSGNVVFFDQPDTLESGTRRLYERSRESYFPRARESQYATLERKVMVEENIAAGGSVAADDYKFHCSRGRIIFCQYDTGRFTDHRRAVIDVPGFDVLKQTLTYERPERPLQKPAHWDEMMRIAEAISADFDYARIDLYDEPGGVYFGEITLTPEGGVNAVYSDRAFERFVLDCIRQGRDAARTRRAATPRPIRETRRPAQTLPAARVRRKQSSPTGRVSGASPR